MRRMADRMLFLNVGIQSGNQGALGLLAVSAGTAKDK